jgi:hypothetical protein
MTSETLHENTTAFDTASGVFDGNSERGDFSVFAFRTGLSLLVSLSAF